MSDFGDWLQNYGLDWVRLFVEGALLAAVIFYSRKLLRTLRASQEQVGALLRLSVSGSVHDQPPTRHENDEFASRPASAPAFPSAAPSGFDSAPAYAAPTPTPSYSHSSILGPINGIGQREQSLGGRVAADRGTATMVEEPPAETFAHSSVHTEAPPLTPWVGAPLSSAAPERSPVAAAVQWLQSAPAPRKRRGNPIMRAIRWLQAPAGSHSH